MRNFELEAAIWHLFTSIEIIDAASHECEQIKEWFGNLAVARQSANFGRNNQIFDKLKQRANEFKRAAELAKLDDYSLAWLTATYISGDIRGIMEQPLRSWMSASEYREFSEIKIGRLLGYSKIIESSLNNAMVKAESFFHPNPNCPERRNDDDGFPGSEIVDWYDNYVNWDKGPLFSKIQSPPPEYIVKKSIACKTGEEVPLTGIWYPKAGLEKHSLTFAVKGLRMQPAFKILKTVAERERENDGAIFSSPETVAVEMVWHPLTLSNIHADNDRELWAKAGSPCPKSGIWQPTDPGAAQRTYRAGEPMADLKSAYGYTVWKWIADR